MPIHLAKYDPAWVAMFERAREELSAALPENVVHRIEHVGSTAIIGMPAKPVIDMIAGIHNFDDVEQLEGPLEALGYVAWHGAEGRNTYERRDPAGQAIHHLHVVQYGGQIWKDQITFRDHLRTNEADRQTYARVKCHLSQLHNDTRDYSQAKSSTILNILARARLDGVG